MAIRQRITTRHSNPALHNTEVTVVGWMPGFYRVEWDDGTARTVFPDEIGPTMANLASGIVDAIYSFEEKVARAHLRLAVEQAIEAGLVEDEIEDFISDYIFDREEHGWR